MMIHKKIKKMKTSEPGTETKINIPGNMQFESPLPSNPIPNIPQGSFPGHIPQNIQMMHQNMRMYPGYPYGMPNKPGFPIQGENPPNMPPNMPPQQWQGLPFNPQQMMYSKQETFIDVEPYFQQLLLKFPPSEGLIEKLPSSKTPVIDAFIYCSICNWGVSISPSQDRLPSTFTITDFNKYWEYSQKICSKPSPTETPVARLKALRRWFADFPGIKKIKAVKEGKEPILIKVKPERIGDVIAIVKKYSQIINTRCRSLVQTSISHQPSFSNNIQDNGQYE